MIHTVADWYVGSGGCLRNMKGTHYFELTFKVFTDVIMGLVNNEALD